MNWKFQVQIIFMHYKFKSRWKDSHVVTINPKYQMVYCVQNQDRPPSFPKPMAVKSQT